MRRYYRYQDSPAQQSTNELKAKQLANTTAFVTPTAAKNPEAQLLRLPQLNSMRRSASFASTQRNTKFKLTNLEDKIEELGAQVHNTRLDAQETLNHISFLKESLVTNELGRLQEDLKKQVKGLQRYAKSVQVSNQDRSRTIKQDCAQLWKQTEQLHQNLFELRMRTQLLEENMGYGSKNRQ